MKDKIPEFKSLKEVAAFWDTHDAADYLDEFESVELEIEASEANCHRCGGETEVWWVDLPLAQGLLVVRRVRFLRCRTPGCHTVTLPADVRATLTKLQQSLGVHTLEELVLAAAQEELESA